MGGTARAGTNAEDAVDAGGTVDDAADAKDDADDAAVTVVDAEDTATTADDTRDEGKTTDGVAEANDGAKLPEADWANGDDDEDALLRSLLGTKDGEFEFKGVCALFFEAIDAFSGGFGSALGD